MQVPVHSRPFVCVCLPPISWNKNGQVLCSEAEWATSVVLLQKFTKSFNLYKFSCEWFDCIDPLEIQVIHACKVCLPGCVWVKTKKMHPRQVAGLKSPVLSSTLSVRPCLQNLCSYLMLKGDCLFYFGDFYLQ